MVAICILSSCANAMRAEGRFLTANSSIIEYLKSSGDSVDDVSDLYLMNNDAINAKDEHGRTPLDLAVIYGRFDIVQYLCETCHANVNIKDKYGYTPISLAVSNGHLGIVKYLYETCHANVEIKNTDWQTPLFIATMSCDFDIVKYLYETCHANVNIKDKYGRTPIDFASEEGYLEIVEYLYETCHANVDNETIGRATDEVSEYLLNKLNE